MSRHYNLSTPNCPYKIKGRIIAAVTLSIVSAVNLLAKLHKSNCWLLQKAGAKERKTLLHTVLIFQKLVRIVCFCC